MSFVETKRMFEYGFSNFSKWNVAENDTKYNMDSHGLFYSENDVLGNSKPILSLNADDYLVLPNTISFADLHSVLCYDTETPLQAAVVTYTYQDWPVGKASIDFTGDLESNYEFDPSEEFPEEESTPAPTPSAEPSETEKEVSAFARIGKVLLHIFLVLIGLIALVLAVLFIRRSIIIRRRRNRRRRSQQPIRYVNDPYARLNRPARNCLISDAKRRQRAAESNRRNSKRNARRH